MGARLIPCCLVNVYVCMSGGPNFHKRVPKVPWKWGTQGSLKCYENGVPGSPFSYEIGTPVTCFLWKQGWEIWWGEGWSRWAMGMGGFWVGFGVEGSPSSYKNRDPGPCSHGVPKSLWHRLKDKIKIGIKKHTGSMDHGLSRGFIWCHDEIAGHEDSDKNMHVHVVIKTFWVTCPTKW